MNIIGKYLVFEKDFQNFLKNKYKNSLINIYNNDDKMIKYAMNKIAYLIPICYGKHIICIEKPSLKKDFYFGYSDIGQGLSYEENNKVMDEFKKNLEQNFRESNLSNIDSMINDLVSIKDNKSSTKIMHYVKYYSDKDSFDDSVIHDFGFDDPWRGKSFSGEGRELNVNDIKTLIYGYEYLKEYMNKKIDAYIKKYGTSKLHVSSYWIDR